MSSFSQENNNPESSCRYSYENLGYEHLKKVVAGAYHRILLTNDSYGKGYISYAEWHKRLENEIILVQAYKMERIRSKCAASEKRGTV